MTEITKIEPTEITKIEEPQQSTSVTPMVMIDRALQSGAGVETIEKLMALQERWEANNARRAFDAAIAAAKSEIKPIVKGSEVDFKSKRTGDKTNYKYETLDGIAQHVDPILAKYGLSYRFRSHQENGSLHVTCVIAHRDGYSEETTLSGPPDQSGNKNAYQAVGSAATYLQRYTLKLALGLSAAKDDDAQGAGTKDDGEKNKGPNPAETVSPEQFSKLQEKANEAGVDEQKLCKAYEAQSMQQFPARYFDSAMKKLNKTIEANEEEQRKAFNQQKDPSVADDIVGDEIPY